MSQSAPASGHGVTQDQLEDSAKENRTLLFLKVGAAAFVAVTVASARDGDIISQTSGLKLPLIDVEVSVRAFYWVMPPLLWALAAYLHLEVVKIIEAAAELKAPQWWPTSVLAAKREGQVRFWQLFKQQVRTQQVLVFVERAITDLVVWWAVPLTLGVACVRLIPFAERLSFKWCALWLVIATMSAWSVRSALGKLRLQRSFRRWAMMAAAAIAAACIALRLIDARTVMWASEQIGWGAIDFRGADLLAASLESKYAPNAFFEKANLRHAWLARSRLSRATFDAAELDDSMLATTDLRETSFRNASLRRATLQDADLTHAVLEGADLRGARLYRTVLDWTDFSRANLSEHRFETSLLGNINFTGATLTDSNFYRHRLGGLYFNRADLSRAFFAGVSSATGQEPEPRHLSFALATLHRANFVEANLPNVGFDEADLTDANLTSARLDGSSFSGAKLIRVDAYNASFRKAKLMATDLHDANLTRANLGGADLANANLQGARLAGADLRQANLCGANLTGADIPETQLRGAEYDRFTQFPTGFDPAANGLICRDRSAPEIIKN
jgi:uncharacterized protein YjbI with pentapeptide repeats